MKQGYIVLYNTGGGANYCSPVDITVDTLDSDTILESILNEVCAKHFRNTGIRVSMEYLTLVGITKLYQEDKKQIITDIHG